MIKSIVSKEVINSLSAAIGEEKISTDKPTRICYSITHGPEFLFLVNNDYSPNQALDYTKQIYDKDMDIFTGYIKK